MTNRTQAGQIKTTVFDLAQEFGYVSDQKLARAMGISPALLSRVKRDLIGINDTFITGAVRAFPGKSLDELFTVPSQEVA